MKAVAINLLMVLLFAGCAGQMGAPGPRSDEQLLSDARGPEENRRLHTDLVRKMIDEDRLHAAMAHLDAQEKEFGATATVRLLRAEILRKLGRTDEAEQLYTGLIEADRYRGRSEHGLGLIHAPDELARGIRHLEQAVELRPTDARIRNDLGYALMKRGRIDDARLHLATAHELESSSELSRNNYIVVLLLDDQEDEARRVAARAGVGEDTMTRLQARAKNLENEASSVDATAATAEPPRIGAGGG